AHDGDRRRFERADFRAHQGRARGAARRPRRDQRGIQPRVPDAPRHAHRRAHLSRVPVPVRHRTDPRIRRHAVGGPAVEPVHVDLRVEDAVRAGARAPPPGRDAVNLAMHIFNHPNYNFLRWRWHALAVSWIIILAGIAVIARYGIPRSTEFAGGTEIILAFDKPTSEQQVREALAKAFPGGDAIVQSYGDRSQRQIMVRVPTVLAESGTALS